MAAWCCADSSSASFGSLPGAGGGLPALRNTTIRDATSPAAAAPSIAVCMPTRRCAAAAPLAALDTVLAYVSVPILATACMSPLRKAELATASSSWEARPATEVGVWAPELSAALLGGGLTGAAVACWEACALPERDTMLWRVLTAGKRGGAARGTAAGEWLAAWAAFEGGCTPWGDRCSASTAGERRCLAGLEAVLDERLEDCPDQFMPLPEAELG